MLAQDWVGCGLFGGGGRVDGWIVGRAGMVADGWWWVRCIDGEVVGGCMGYG